MAVKEKVALPESVLEIIDSISELDKKEALFDWAIEYKINSILTFQKVKEILSLITFVNSKQTQTYLKQSFTSKIL
jgi:hypothetical protein